MDGRLRLVSIKQNVEVDVWAAGTLHPEAGPPASYMENEPLGRCKRFHAPNSTLCRLATLQPPHRYEKTELSTLALDTMTSVAERTITNVSSAWLRPQLWVKKCLTTHFFTLMCMLWRSPSAHRQWPVSQTQGRVLCVVPPGPHFLHPLPHSPHFAPPHYHLPPAGSGVSD